MARNSTAVIYELIGRDKTRNAFNSFTRSADRAINKTDMWNRSLRAVPNRVKTKMSVDVDKDKLGKASRGIADSLGGSVFSVSQRISPLLIAGIAAAVPLVPPAAALVGGALVLGIGGAFAGLGTVIAVKSHKGIQRAFKTLGKDIYADLVTASQPFVRLLLKAPDQIRRAWRTVGPEIAKSFKLVAPGAEILFKGLLKGVTALSPYLPGIASAFTKLAKAIGPKLPGLFDSIGRALGGLAAAVGANAPGIAGLIVRVLKLAPFAINLFTRFIKWFSWINGTAVPTIKHLYRWFRNLFDADPSSGATKFVNKLNTWLRTTDWTAVGRTVGTALASAITFAAVAGKTMTKKFIGLMRKVDWHAVGAAVGHFAGGFITGALGGALRAAGHSLNATAHSVGGFIARGLGAGFRHAWRLLIPGLQIRALIDYVKHVFGIHSPSTVFAGIGRDIVRGLVNGLTSWWGKHVTPWLRGRRGAVLGWFGKAGTWLYGRGRDVITGFGHGLTNRYASVNAWVKNTKNRVLQWFGHTGTWIYVKGKDVMTGFWHGLQQPWNGIKKWVSGIAKTIKGLKGPIAADRKLLVPEGKAIMGGLLAGIKAGTGALLGHVAGTGALLGHVAGIGGTIGQILQQAAAQFGWGSGPQLNAVKWIVQHESGGRPTAQNPTSSAYGLFQFLNGTWGTVGGHKTSNPALQALYGMRYIKKAYGSPLAAMAFWQRHHWYAAGTRSALPGWAVVGENGPELVRMRGGEQVKSNRDSERALQQPPTIGNVNFYQYKGTAREAVDELSFLVHQVRNGGVYA